MKILYPVRSTTRSGDVVASRAAVGTSTAGGTMAYIVSNSGQVVVSDDSKYVSAGAGAAMQSEEEFIASNFQNGILISEGDEEFISSHLQNGAQLTQGDEEFILLTLQNGTQSPQDDDEFGIQGADEVQVDTHGASEVIQDSVEYIDESELQIVEDEQTITTSAAFHGEHEYALNTNFGDVKYFTRLPTIPQTFEETILPGDLIPAVDDETVISNVQSTIEIGEDDKSSLLMSLSDPKTQYLYEDDSLASNLYRGSYVGAGQSKKKPRYQSTPKSSKSTQGNFQCLQCPKSFVSQKALTTHSDRYHKQPAPSAEKDSNSDQPFACPYCPKRFYLHMSLLIHQDHCGRVAAKLQKRRSPSSSVYKSGQRKGGKERLPVDWSEQEEEERTASSDSGDETDDSIPKKKRRGGRPPSKFMVNLKQKTPGLEEMERHRSGSSVKREKVSDEEVYVPLEQSSEVKEEPLSGDSYSCPHCQRCFTFQASYLRHEAKCRALVGKTLECDVCGLTFRSVKYLHEHRISHLEQSTTFSCSHCRKTFKSEKNLRTHERKCLSGGGSGDFVKQESDSWDDDDDSSGSDTDDDDSSSGSDETDDEYKCPKCFKVFRQKSHLKGHLHTHTTLKPFACDKCPDAFTNRKHLAIHLKTVHQPPLAFQCKKCPRSFASSYLLDYHVTCAHKTIREFQCEQCNRKFARKNHYAVHMREHSGIKSFRCDRCPRAFTQRLFLEYHMTTHLGIKPFLCKICHRNFSRKCHLVIHMKKH